MSIKTSLFNLLLGVDMAAGGLGGVPDLTVSAHAGMPAWRRWTARGAAGSRQPW